MKKYFAVVSLLTLLIIFFGCAGHPKINRDPNVDEQNWVENKLESLTLHEKIGQLILMSRRATFFNENSESWKTIQHDIQDNNIFGYHIWGSEALTLQHYTNKMQKLAKTPLIFTADFERGVGFLVDGATSFPFNMAFGATRDPDLAYEFGKYTAIESRLVGVTQIFNPVVDINNNPDNPIINLRSFGEKPELVNKMAGAYVEGCQSEGVSCCAKHFPGHGDTETDSHLELPVIKAELDSLENLELIPFKKMIDKNVYAVMSAHISLPELQGEIGLPATLSPEIINGLLRKKLGYNGVVYTDAMEMGGISNNFTREYAYVQAIKAGCDVLINSGNISSDTLIAAIKDAVDRGQLTETRIDSSVRRILTMKKKLGLHKTRFSDLSNMEKQLASREIEEFARKASEKAITLPIDNNKLIPINQNYNDVVVISLYDNDQARRWNPFNSSVRQRIPYASSHILDQETDSLEYNKILNNISDSTLVILGTFARYRAFKGSIAFYDQQIDFVKKLSDRSDNMITVTLGNPYILQQFPEIDTYLISFGWEPVQQRAAAGAIFGDFPIQGKMPITIPGLVNYGDGIQTEKLDKKIRFEQKLIAAKPKSLETGFPHEAGISLDELSDLEELLISGVQDSAYPGGTFLAAKDGIIFHKKAFGNFSYEKDAKKVEPKTIYDLASITKVVATTSAAMLLYDRGRLDLDRPVYEILPEFGQKGKDQITFRHLLTHSSGLPAWAPLWAKGKGAEKMMNTIYELELEYRPGTKSVYSCLGFITLGKAIEKIAGMPLNEFVEQEIFNPLNMDHTYYNPPIKYYDNIAPTEYDSARGGIVTGKVHDENAYYIGGISGNAGLFSNVHDLAIFSQMMLNKGIYRGRRIFQPETVELFTKRQNLVNGSSRCLGWDSPSGKSSSGHYFSEKSFGHTGFTGTSVWIDPEQDLFGILLTNRVHPTRKNRKLYKFRYKIYDELQKSIKNVNLNKNPNVYQNEE